MEHFKELQNNGTEVLKERNISPKKKATTNYGWIKISIIIEYQKITNLLTNTPNQPSKFRTKNWVETNDESRLIYNANSQIKFKTTMLKSGLCDYSDAYILVKGTINSCWHISCRCCRK